MEKTQLDILWVLLATIMIVGMQAGFLFLEAGMTRSKNATNIAMKNVTDTVVTVLGFWVCGFAIMFGSEQDRGLFDSFFTPIGQSAEPWLSTFFLFQTFFCATTATIISGAIAERVRFVSYPIITMIVVIIIYPIFGRWAWGGAFQGEAGWLEDKGFVDFAGSTVVHSTAGWMSLALLMIIGSRLGRFRGPGEPPREIAQYNSSMAMFGALVLFIGWFGFNGGSTLAFNEQVPGIIANTALAAVSAAAVVGLLSYMKTGYTNVAAVMNGLLAGLVSITAGCHAVSASEAALIGLVGGLCMINCDKLLIRLQIDDAIGAIPVHLAPGIWGTIAVGLFGDLSVLGTGLTRYYQIVIQVEGVLVCALWSLPVSYVLFRLLNNLMPIRVTPEQERVGLNVSEHASSSELIQILDTMELHKTLGDTSVRLPEEPFTDLGQIAGKYNEVMTSLEQNAENKKATLLRSKVAIVNFDNQGIIAGFDAGAEKLFQMKPEQGIGQSIEILFADGHNNLALTNPRELIYGITNYAAGFRRGRMFPIQFSFSKAMIGNLDLYTATISEYTTETTEQPPVDNSLPPATFSPEQAKSGAEDTIQMGPNGSLTTTITMKWNEEGKGESS
ncbi:MAG: ammonium transporter [Methylococcaceae bacterium]